MGNERMHYTHWYSGDLLFLLLLFLAYSTILRTTEELLFNNKYHHTTHRYVLLIYRKNGANSRIKKKNYKIVYTIFYYLKYEYVGNGMKTIDISWVQHTV